MVRWLRARAHSARELVHPATRRVVRLAVRRGPWNAVNAIVAVVEESTDPEAVADEAILRLRSVLPLDAPSIVGLYVQGLVPFGYYHADDGYYWRRIDERGLITPATARIPSGTRRRLAKEPFDIRFDTDSEEIIDRCRRTDGSWINEPMVQALRGGLRRGVVTTLGAYDDDVLVGGEFGLVLSGWYHSMSTFHDVPNAGNALFARVVTEIRDGGRFVVCDVGEMKPHSVQFGAVPTSLDAFESDLLTHLGSTPDRGTA